jgi:hypothetical protein
MHGYPVTCGGKCGCLTESSSSTGASVPAAPAPDKIRAIFIKSYKVASTTVATIFQRLTEERGLKMASRYNAGVPLHESGRGSYHVLYGHNFYTMGTRGGFPCEVKQLDDGQWTHCGGYQIWMDYYIEDAAHLVMVADPTERAASMYYYEAGYTKQKDRGPADTEYLRINSEARFADPRGVDDTHITHFLTDAEYYNKWERVQWWWLRESTPHNTVDETIALLNEQFLVGLPGRLDESLLLWKAAMGLATRDIIYTSMKASLSHPKTADWSDSNQARVRDLVETNGDLKYYQAAQAKFEAQAEQYGKAALAEDATRFGALLARLRAKCIEFVVENEQLHVPDQVYCMLKHYDAAYENEAVITENLGCFNSLQTSGGRMRQMLFSSGLTISACLRRCLKGTDEASFDVFALGFGTHCYCGTGDVVASTRLDATECQASCGGNPTKNCGGTVAYTFHRTTPRGTNWTDGIITGESLT